MNEITTKLTTKQERFLEALVSHESKGDVRKAMTLAGYSKATKTAYLAKELSTQIKEATELLLALYAPKAAMALTSMLDDDADFDLNTRHVLAAAKTWRELRSNSAFSSSIEVSIIAALGA